MGPAAHLPCLATLPLPEASIAVTMDLMMVMGYIKCVYMIVI